MPAPTTPAEKEELAITYAALVLHDDNLPITVRFSKGAKNWG